MLNLKVSPIISIKNVGKSFGSGTLAVSGMTLDIFKNEFISFLGPSGCGKSTLLKMISGLLRPTTGRIKILGNQNHTMEISEDIGFVFQDATLMPWSTVQDNVFLPLRLKGFSRKQASEEIENVLPRRGPE